MQPDADTASNLAMFTQEGYKKPQRPQFLLGNHTSFMDSILLSRILPRNIAFRLRAYVASHVARLPLFGTLMRASGHFIVPYSSEQYDSFELNTALMAQTQEVVTEHLQNNGNLMFFPEGRVNATPDSIGSLRLGGFKLALEYDAAIWTVVFYGITIPGPRQRQGTP